MINQSARGAEDTSRSAIGYGYTLSTSKTEKDGPRLPLHDTAADTPGRSLS